MIERSFREMGDRRRIVMMRARETRVMRKTRWRRTGGYAKRFEKGGPDNLVGIFKDMSRSFDAFSYLFD